MFNKAITIASSLFFVFLQAKTQSFEEKNFTLYSTKDGLSDRRIMGLAQDEFGYIWIATKKGLNRFDGNNFLQFYSDSSRNSLINDDIKQLRWLSKEQLGVATPTGLHIIHPRTLQQRNITVPPGPLQYEYRENNIYGIAGDAEGNIFLLTGSGFYHFNNKDELVFRYDHYKKEREGESETPFGRSDGIIMPEKGMFLLATIAGPYIYDIAKKDLHPLDETGEPLYRQTAPAGGWIHFMHGSSNSFSVIKEGAKELSWFDLRQKKKYPLQTSLSGLNMLFNWRTRVTRLNDSTFIITAMQKGFYLIHFNRQSDNYEIAPELYLPNYLCTSVLLDKNNRLWIGTDRGLLHQKKNAGDLEKINIPAEMNPFGRSLDITMMTIANNKIFVGTQGGGIYVFDRSSLQPLKRIDFSKLKGYDYANNINNIISFNDDSIYTSTFGPVVGVNANNYNFREVILPDWNALHNWTSWQFMSSDKVWYISANKNNRFYYRRAYEKNFTQVDHTSNHLFNIHMPRCITEDPSGNIWFTGHGASRFNIHTQQFDMLIDSFPKIKTTRKEIKSIAIDKRGKMYFGLVENGLVIYDPAQKKFEHITRSDGLPDNTVRAIYLHKNKLWLGTESGLANYDIDTKKISPFGIADDMPEGAFTAYSFFYDSVHRQLYGGFNNTFIRFNPDSLSKNNSPPDFFIENINVAGRDVIYHPLDKVELSYKHNSIVVNLVSINFEDAYQQQFAYRFVKNGNEPWQETGSQRSIIFSNLSPGQHHLQLKVYIKNNSWQEQVKEILIIVHPPFWQTASFILLAGAVILLFLYGLFRLRIKNIRQKANIDKELAELEIKGLHAQMNPHFIFNSLNSIKEMILEDEKQNASRYLSKFAQLIRTNLEQSRQTFITVKQCIDHLQQYLEMEKIRFGGFSYTINADEDLPENIRMAPMLIQPLVENAIWHGLQNQTDERKLNIRFYKSGKQLVCEIEDNGVGINRSMQEKTGSRPAHRSLGIQNIQERLKVLNEKYNMNGSLSITDRSELPGNKCNGTLVVLKFNI